MITMKYTIDQLKKLVLEAGTPTEGHLAAFIWESLSGNSACAIPIPIARDIYRELGYRPFSGYPLQRLKG